MLVTRKGPDDRRQGPTKSQEDRPGHGTTDERTVSYAPAQPTRTGPAMSVRAVSWVLHESKSTGNDRLVLIVVADEADNDGLDAFPSIERIAALARLNRRTVLRSIGRLEAGGDLLVRRPDHPGRGRFNRYALTMGRPPMALAGSLGWPPPPLDPLVLAEWEALTTGDTMAPTIDGPQPCPPSVDNVPGKVQKGDTGDRFGNSFTPGGAQDPKTLIDTGAHSAERQNQGRRRGLDPAPPGPLDRTAAAARARAAEGNRQHAATRATVPAAADLVAATLDEARRALGAGATVAHLRPGDGSTVRTPNEDDFTEMPGDEQGPP